MITVFVVIVFWLFTAWLASRIFIDAWRFQFDVDREDRAFFRLMSFAGPVSLALAVIIWIMDYYEHRNRTLNRNRDIIYPRKEKS